MTQEIKVEQVLKLTQEFSSRKQLNQWLSGALGLLLIKRTTYRTWQVFSLEITP